MSVNITKCRPGPKGRSTFKRKGGFPDPSTIPSHLRLTDGPADRIGKLDVLNDLSRDRWEDEIDTEVALLRAKFGTPQPMPEPIHSRSRRETRVVYDPQTLEPRLERGRVMCRAQQQARLKEKMRVHDQFDPLPGIAGQLQRQMEQLIGLAPHVVTPREYVDQVLALGLALRGDLSTDEIDGLGNLNSGRIRFQDGSCVRFDRDGLR